MSTPPTTVRRRRDQQASSWWSRNWKWFVPVLAVTGFALFAGGVALFVTLLFGAMKSSDVYQGALARAAADPAVVDVLGAPIEAGFTLSGNIHVSNRSGDADLEIPISGPRGEATIRLRATKSEGRWTYDELIVEAESGERIDLGR